MLKFFALALLALHCNCQKVVEVTGDKVFRSDVTHLPVKTVSGLSGISTLGYSGLSGYRTALPISSYFNSLPVHNYGLNINGVNLGYLNGLRSHSYGYGLGNVYGNAINIAPSAYTLGAQRQNYLAIREPGHVAISQPAVSVARHVAFAQPQVQTLGLAVARPQIAIARPHVQVLNQGIQTEAVRPVSAAIHQLGRTVEYRDVPHQEGPIVPQEVIVEPSDQPINIHFRSRSSTVRLSQEHIPGEPGSIEQTQSQDEPSKVVHEVVKPVIQEVREVIQPYRQVTQEVQPVVENVHRIVSSGEAVRQQHIVEQPIVKQVAPIVQAVRPVSYAVHQPQIAVARSAIAVARPAVSQIAISQPAISVAQPVVYGQRFGVEQPIQYQTISAGVEPIVSSIVRQPIISRIAQPYIGYNNIGYNNIGYNRVLSEGIPSISLRQDIREVREPEIEVRRQVVRQERREGNDFVKYAESDD